MLNPDFTESIVKEILEDLPLREKSIIANMNEADTGCLTCKFSRYIKEKAPGCDPMDEVEIMRKVWKELSKSHRLKIAR